MSFRHASNKAQDISVIVVFASPIKYRLNSDMVLISVFCSLREVSGRLYLGMSSVWTMLDEAFVRPQCLCLYIC